MYTLLNAKTNQTSGTYKTAATARKARDRKDLQYGANIYTIVAITSIVYPA